MGKKSLNSEELELQTEFESGEWESDFNENRKESLAAAAEVTAKKDKRINIRISNRDLTALQRRAMEEGMPYQTLVASVLHKYASGSLQDVSANKNRQRT